MDGRLSTSPLMVHSDLPTAASEANAGPITYREHASSGTHLSIILAIAVSSREERAHRLSPLATKFSVWTRPHERRLGGCL